MGAYMSEFLTEEEEKAAILKGRKEGKEEGREEKAIEIAKRILKMNMPIDQVAEFTGLGIEEISGLSNEIECEKQTDEEVKLV